MTTPLDLASVIDAFQAISSEIVLERLIPRLMEVVLDPAGAERGVVVLEERGELLVQVDGPASGGTPVARYPGISEAIVRRVAETREAVVLNDAAGAEGDARRPGSILCAPLVSRGRLLGVLYIERGATAGAFAPARVDLLRLLSSQIAISIENARLYGEMERRVEAALLHLGTTQARLVESEKMASLGQLTAGIAHEIKNPLNFVNNFAELSAELTGELSAELEQRPDARLADVRDTFGYLKVNAEKICEHGKRADAIVRSMMQHASGAAGERRPTDVNVLTEEYVSLAYHGARAQQHDFNVNVERDYDPSIGEIDMLPQEMGRVFVNLLNNAFYSVRERQLAEGGAYAPRVAVMTRRRGDQVEITVRDNGLGIPEAVRNKIFVPFFTTKPPGAGTGLGLSMSYDIVVHGHRGMLAVESAEGEGAAFMITLPA